MHCIGIDISKQTLAVFDGRQQETFPNKAGLASFDCWLWERFPPGTPAPVLIFEATGVYSHELTRFCHRRQLAVHILNPKRSHHFRGAIGQRSKNDPLDARTLYAYHLILPEEAYAVPRSDPLVETLHHFLSLHQLAQTSRVRYQNHQEAMISSGQAPASLLATCQAEVQRQRQQEEDLLAEAIAWVEQQPELAAPFRRLQTIPGIGPRIALCLLQLERTYPGTNRQQLTALVGLDPRERESGTSLHPPRRISKNGQALVRRQLYLAALSATRQTPHFLAPTYQRLLQRGKRKKQALMAVARKLLLVAHAIYNSEEPYQEGGRSKMKEVVMA